MGPGHERARCRLRVAVVLALAVVAPPTSADPTDSLPAACDGLAGTLPFPADVHAWDGTDEQGGFVDYGGGSMHWADNWWPAQGVPGATDRTVLGIHPCLQSVAGQILALGDFAGPEDPAPSAGADLVNAALIVHGGRFALDLGGRSYELSDPAAPLKVGVFGPYAANQMAADLHVTGGGTLDADPGSAYPNARVLVGESAGGSITVTGAGTRLDTPSAVGVSGVAIGLAAGGTLRIESGARVQSPSSVEIGAGSGGGAAIVTGAGSTWQLGNLEVGNLGPGSLVVEGGGGVTAWDVDVEQQGSSIIRGLGSTFNVHTIDVTGSLLIESGGAVDAFQRSSIAGDVTVRGAGSSFDGGDQLRAFGGAALRIEDGGIFEAFMTLEDGSVVVTGAGSELRGSLALGAVTARIETGAVYEGGLSLTSEASRFELAGGAAVIGDMEPVAGQLRVGLFRSLTGAGTIVGDVVGDGAWIRPDHNSPYGSLIATLTIDGDLTLDSATRPPDQANRLLMQLSTQDGAIVNDRITVSGRVDLGNAVLSTSFLGSIAQLDAGVLPEDGFVLIEGGDAIEGDLQLFSGETIASGDLVPIQASASPETRYFRVFYGAASPHGANRLVLTGFSFVPEPNTLLLLAAGTAMLGLRRRLPQVRVGERPEGDALRE